MRAVPPRCLIPGRRAFLTICFVVFLYPISVDGMSVNYSFVLVPLLSLLLCGNGRRPDDATMFIMGLFVLILAVAFLYQVELTDEGPRRLISFIIFMTVFAYMFMKVDAAMIEAFKRAIVAISLCFSLRSMYLLFDKGGDLGFEAKDIVGSQRYGFIYLVAIWLVYLENQRCGVARLAKYATLVVLTTGVLLTFSRASVVALLVTVGLFGASRLRAWLSGPNVRGVLKVGASMAGAVALIVMLRQGVPLAFTFFGERLFALLSDSDAVGTQLLDPRESAGTRMVLAVQILEFVTHNPLTGSGYLGVWILPGASEGSAHNQYMDVLFRTGFLGLMAYGYILLRLLRYLANYERPLLWGFVGVLVYGMFHETFKESQGAFVLAFLLGMMAQQSRVRGIMGQGGLGGESRRPAHRRIVVPTER